MSFKNFFSRQAKRPTGLFGRFITSRLFAKGNAPVNTLVLETMAVSPDDHILEIGCGPGLLIRDLADRLNQGQVQGVDFSKSMVSIARKKNRQHINHGTVLIHLGDFNQSAFEPESFDKIVTVNTIYFWNDPADTLDRICRLLKPGGKLFIGFTQKSDMEKMSLDHEIFRMYSLDDMSGFLNSHPSLSGVEISSRPAQPNPVHCAVACKTGQDCL